MKIRENIDQLIIAGLCGVLLHHAFWVTPRKAKDAREELANQIANGTHEVKWSTNEFGTMEVRIVEVK